MGCPLSFSPGKTVGKTVLLISLLSLFFSGNQPILGFWFWVVPIKFCFKFAFLFLTLLKTVMGTEFVQ
jgi:hypothetical protein